MVTIPAASWAKVTGDSVSATNPTAPTALPSGRHHGRVWNSDSGSMAASFGYGYERGESCETAASTAGCASEWGR